MARGPISDEQKKAMQEGRSQSKAVGAYLEAFEAQKPKRGRKRTEASIQKRLDQITDEFDSLSGIKQLEAIQERRDLEDELESMKNKPDLSGLEAAFVDAAKAYGERKGINYATWREFGVPAAVLKRAGISRSD